MYAYILLVNDTLLLLLHFSSVKNTMKFTKFIHKSKLKYLATILTGSIHTEL